MMFTPEQGEQLIKKGQATQYVGPMPVTGDLYLTNRALHFIVHPLNASKYSLHIPLGQIKTIETRTLFRVFSHGFTIELASGDYYEFAVWNRQKWIGQIKQAKTNLNSAHK